MGASGGRVGTRSEKSKFGQIAVIAWAGLKWGGIWNFWIMQIAGLFRCLGWLNMPPILIHEFDHV